MCQGQGKDKCRTYVYAKISFGKADFCRCFDMNTKKNHQGDPCEKPCEHTKRNESGVTFDDGSAIQRGGKADAEQMQKTRYTESDKDSVGCCKGKREEKFGFFHFG